MIVKIGEFFFDSDVEPIMLILSEDDMSNIRRMPDETTRYASFPNGWGTKEQMELWMGCGGD